LLPPPADTNVQELIREKDTALAVASNLEQEVLRLNRRLAREVADASARARDAEARAESSESALLSRVPQLESRVADLRQKLEVAHGASADADRELREARAAAEALRDDARKSRAAMQAATRRSERAESRAEALEKDVEALEARLARTDMVVSRLNDENRSLARAASTASLVRVPTTPSIGADAGRTAAKAAAQQKAALEHAQAALAAAKANTDALAADLASSVVAASSASLGDDEHDISASPNLASAVAGAQAALTSLSVTAAHARALAAAARDLNSATLRLRSILDGPGSSSPPPPALGLPSHGEALRIIQAASALCRRVASIAGADPLAPPLSPFSASAGLPGVTARRASAFSDTEGSSDTVHHLRRLQSNLSTARTDHASAVVIAVPQRSPLTPGSSVDDPPATMHQ
jgi:hypothetical protein